MLQLWSFFNNSPNPLKVYIKVAMQMERFDDLLKSDQKITGENSREDLSDKTIKLTSINGYCIL